MEYEVPLTRGCTIRKNFDDAVPGELLGRINPHVYSASIAEFNRVAHSLNVLILVYFALSVVLSFGFTALVVFEAITLPLVWRPTVVIAVYALVLIIIVILARRAERRLQDVAFIQSRVLRPVNLAFSYITGNCGGSPLRVVEIDPTSDVLESALIGLPSMYSESTLPHLEPLFVATNSNHANSAQRL